MMMMMVYYYYYYDYYHALTLFMRLRCSGFLSGVTPPPPYLQYIGLLKS